MNYKSSAALFGLPLVHVTTHEFKKGSCQRGVAKGWIAVGDVSFGIILSVGGLACGGIAIGGLSAGILSIGGLALGIYAMGGGAAGVIACGGAAFGLHAAYGGLAVAETYALGGGAFAEHANDQIAKDYFQSHFFYKNALFLMNHSRWLIVLVFIPIVPWFVRGRKKPGEEN